MQHSASARQDSSGYLLAIKMNDEKVLGELYALNFEKVSVYIRNNSGTEEDARDIFQEAFLAVWRNIQADRFVPVGESAVSGYLFQIAKNKWIDVLRKKKRNPLIAVSDPSLIDTEEPGPLSEEEEDYVGRVALQFTKLGHPCKELLSRFYFRKESLRTIAAAFAWTEASAKNNKYRCLQKLRGMVVDKK